MKHYPRQINWRKCEQSIDRAASNWRPRRITFVFPQDLTGARVKAFERRLRTRRPGIDVDRWTASDLNARLDEHPDIRRSFFEHRTDLLHTIMRAAQLKERPEEADALLEHGIDLAELVNELDPHFAYELQSRSADVPEAIWLRPPFMAARITGPDVESVLSAWSRPEAAEPRATWTFTDDDRGETARERVYRGFAAGESVELTDGFQVTASPTPRAMAALIEAAQTEADGADAEQRLVTTPVQETVSLDVELEDRRALQEIFTFEMRPAPPRDEHQGAWVGHSAGVLLYVGYQLSDDRTLKMHVSPMLELTSSAGANSMAVQTIIELMSGPLVLRGEIVPKDARLDLREELEETDLPHLRFLRDAYNAIIEIEVHTGRVLRLPDVIGAEEALNAIELAHILRTGAASGTAQLKTFLETPPEAAAEIAMRLTSSRQVVLPLERDVLGVRLSAGWVRVTFERVSVTITPGGALKPTTQVSVQAEGSMDMRVIDEPLPLDVVVHPGSEGRWTTAVASLQSGRE